MNIKTLFKIIFIWMIFSSATCAKEGENCHRKITVVNNSNQPVIVAFKFFNFENKCILNGSEILANENYVHHSNRCWEDNISFTKHYELFIVDTVRYNKPEIFYSCDSIEYYNTVLKHYKLTLEELKSINFTINYP